jgi:hypothetical protein
MSTYASVFKSPTYWLELAVGIGGITLAAMQGQKGGSRGRRYAPSEWLEFFTEPQGEVTPQMRRSAEGFTDKVRAAYHAWSLQNDLGDLEVDMDEVAYRTYASLVGHGIGLWDGELFQNAGVSRSKADDLGKKLDAAMKKNRALSQMAHRLEELVSLSQMRDED